MNENEPTKYDVLLALYNELRGEIEELKDKIDRLILRVYGPPAEDE